MQLNAQSNAQSDSARSIELKKKVEVSYKNRDWDTFKKVSEEQLRLAESIKDTSRLAKTYEYKGAYFRRIDKIDSAYYHFYRSFRLYDEMKDSIKAGRLLVNLAILQKNIRDYKGSEDTSLKALVYLSKSQNKRRISSIYNNLGVVYDEQGDMVNAIKYHQKAREIRQQLDNQLYFVHSLNNLGKLFKDDGQYEEAIIYFERALQYRQIIDQYPLVYATLIDNKAHALFKSGTEKDILRNFDKALTIREKEVDKDGIIISCIHLSEYHNILGNRKKAIDYAERAESISLEIKNFRDYLVSLELVSSMYESPKAQEHFKRYIGIRDSIDRASVSYKNQFDRIRFETDEKDNTIKSQSDRIRKKNHTILFIVLVVFLILILWLGVYYKRKITSNKLQVKLQEGFEAFIKDKYKLTNQNLEFWITWVNEGGQEAVASKLFISVDAVKSRRRSLKNKLSRVESISGDFDRAKAIILFKKEWDFFKNQSQSS